MQGKSPIDEEIEVSIDDRHIPSAFKWRGKPYRISKIQECWRLIGDWWDGDGETTHFRVECPNRAVFEIFYDSTRRWWFMERVID